MWESSTKIEVVDVEGAGEGNTKGMLLLLLLGVVV
jgi:hypothetical protein